MTDGNEPPRERLAWQALGQRQALRADATNRFAIVPEVLPIVFVPGIMGSRLQGATGPVWDPDDALAFCSTLAPGLYSLAAKKAVLIGPQGYDSRHLWPADAASSLDPQASFNQLVQSAYGGVQHQLARLEPSPAMRLCFDMPAYAFAYNWTQSPEQSGALLAKHIGHIIAQHQGDKMCRRVIVVTHSMGGLVARAASQWHGAGRSILGMVHVCQPMAGAPALYLAIKAGFRARMPAGVPLAARLKTLAQELALAHLLGATAQEVAPVLGQMPGALSLLPNHLYRMPSGQPGWVTLQPAWGAAVQHQLPAIHDPYEEIYRARGTVSSLFTLPAACSHPTDVCQKPGCWQRTWATVDDAEVLHRRLGARCHPNSHHIVGTGVATAVSAPFLATGQVAGRAALTLDDRPSPSRDALAPRAALAYAAEGDGDGTVPVQSALCGVAEGAHIHRVPGVEHSTAMMAPAVMALVKTCIRQFAHRAIAEGFGAAGQAP